MRKRLLIIIIASIVLAAVALRVGSHLFREVVTLPSTMPASGPAPAIAAPRDYVSHPLVVSEEAEAGLRRIVSLAPSVTEIVCALGMRDRLVGRTRYCVWPPGITSVPEVGVLAESNYGLVKSLAPDLVLAPWNSGQAVADLRRLGLRCEALDHKGLEGVFAAILKVGELCDRPRTARQLVEAVRADLRRLEAEAAALNAPSRRVIVLFGDLPVPPKAVFVAGPGLFLDALIERAGHRNAARQVIQSSQGEIPLEVLRLVNPEMILEFREPVEPAVMADVYTAWARVGDLEAIRERRVRTIGGPEWLSAGPRVAIELHRFISVLSQAN